MVRSLIPWTERLPRTFGPFGREMESVMDRFYRRMESLFGPEEELLPSRELFVPRANVVETENEFEVTLDLPGLKPEEFNIELKNGNLWITGERKEEKEEKGKTYHRVERYYGEFRRVIPLETHVKEEEVHAEYEGGVLKITLPKSEEVKPKHISVKGK